MATMLQDRERPCAHSERARWATIQVDADEGTYLGCLYVPEAKRRVSDVLNDERTFICLSDARLNDSESAEPFVALNKRFVRAVRILRDAEAAPIGPVR
jgi:hypothetical protein